MAQLRADVLSGRRQGHVALLADSNGVGADTTNPLYLHNALGRVRDSLAQRYGSAGTGLIIADHAITPPSAVDPRFTVAEPANIAQPTNGMHRNGQWYMTNPAGTQTLDFDPGVPVDEFWVYTFSQAGGIGTAAVDGVTVGTFRNIHTGGSAPTIAAETGYSTGGNGTRTLVHRIPAGALGPHVLRLTVSTGQRLGPIFIEGRSSKLGTFRVSNVSMSGKSLETFCGQVGSFPYNDETNGLYGLPLLDTMRADLLIIGLGNNDYNGGRTAAATKALLVDVIRRQRMSGSNAIGGLRANGDALLVRWPRNGASTDDVLYSEYSTMFRQVAIEENVPLLDLSKHWNDYATANTLGLFANTSHFNENGHRDVASALLNAILA